MDTEDSSEKLRDTYSILAPTRDDAAELAAMAYQAWVDTYPNEEHGITKEYIEGLRSKRLNAGGVEALKERIDRLNYDPSFFLRVAKDKNGSIVGFIDGEFYDDKYELQDLFMKNEAHGSGLATELWHNFKNWSNPDKTVWLHVVPYTDRAPAFYKKIGFEVVPDSEGYYKDTPIPVVVMEYKK